MDLVRRQPAHCPSPYATRQPRRRDRRCLPRRYTGLATDVPLQQETPGHGGNAHRAPTRATMRISAMSFRFTVCECSTCGGCQNCDRHGTDGRGTAITGYRRVSYVFLVLFLLTACSPPTAGGPGVESSEPAGNPGATATTESEPASTPT